jgi:hypothetical protein
MENDPGNVEAYYELKYRKKILVDIELERITKPQCPIDDSSCLYHSHATGCCTMENPDDCDDYLIFKDW